MEDLHAPRHAAIVYAVLSLIAQLLASQASVFSLWFSRRCFERSRGEMITMLYEKMLTRKVIGLHEKLNGADFEAVQDNEVGDTKQSTQEHKKNPDQEKQSASTGKVLNLMR